MLRVIDSIGHLCFSELMQVYVESNSKMGQERYPAYSSDDQLLEAEQDFYHYLRSDFFSQPGACYAVWIENGQYLSAARIEPYADGLLLCGLETAPKYRRKGYGKALITALQSYLARSSGGQLYSHVAKSNVFSLELHKRCGFRVIKDYAVHVDGSVFRDSVTMVYEFEKTES